MREPHWALPVLQEGNFPVREANIPDQEHKRTQARLSVRQMAIQTEHLITGIAGKKDFLMHVKKAHMSPGLASSVALSPILLSVTASLITSQQALFLWVL